MSLLTPDQQAAVFANAVANPPRQDYPRPQFAREFSWLNLNGVWEFEKDPGRSGGERGLTKATSLSGKIVVPFAPESVLSGIGDVDFITAAWYRKEFTVPAHWAGS